MTKIGYFLSSEEFGPRDLVAQAQRADLDAHVAQIQSFVDAGYDEVFVQQIGPDQEGFFKVYEQEVLPRLR